MRAEDHVELCLHRGRQPTRGRSHGEAGSLVQISLRPSKEAAVESTQNLKADRFRALHEGEPFVIPNPWDAGSARVLEALGFKALATTSGGFALTLRRRDGKVTLDEVAAHVSALAEATDLPISVDLENGFGAEPEAAARAITAVAG